MECIKRLKEECNEAKYRLDKRINYSLIKCYLESPLKAHQYLTGSLDLSGKPAIMLGTLVDMMLTTPEIDIVCIPNPPVNMKVPTAMMETFLTVNARVLDEEEAYQAAGYKTSLKEVLKNAAAFGTWLKYQETIKELSAMPNAYPEDLVRRAETLVHNMYDDKLLQPYLRVSEFSEIFYQLPVFTDDYKVLIDGVLINHNHKTIKLFDFKTTSGNPFEFVDAIEKYKYKIQAEFYLKVFTQWATTQPDLAKYKIITTFDFIVIPTTYFSVITPFMVYSLAPTPFVKEHNNARLFDNLDEVLIDLKENKACNTIGLGLYAYQQKSELLRVVHLQSDLDD